MKIAEINRVIKQYFPDELKDYSVHKGTIYKIESEFLLKAYDFESSGNGQYDIAVWCFVQPLFVKSDGLYYNFGDRLTYKKKINVFKTITLEWWDATKENLDNSFKSIFKTITTDGEKYLRSINNIHDFYKKYKHEKDDIRTLEATAYSTILFASIDVQNKLLNRLINLCESDEESDWAINIKQDATRLLMSKTTAERLTILKAWKNGTLKQLQLER